MDRLDWIVDWIGLDWQPWHYDILRHCTSVPWIFDIYDILRHYDILRQLESVEICVFKLVPFCLDDSLSY